LGYYARARYLHAAARSIVEEGGAFPATADDWRRLPGVGPYAAAAIASIAFGEAVPAVDGNVARVVARLYGHQWDTRDPSVRRRVSELLLPAVPATGGGEFNQALMELGALVCRAGRPDCSRCPVVGHCRAFQAGLVESIPLRTAAKPRREVEVAVGILRRGGRLLAVRRAPGGMLGGLWELPGGKRRGSESLEQTVERRLPEETGVVVSVGELCCCLTHAYSHFSIRLSAFHCRRLSGRTRDLEAAAARWLRLEELADYPFGTAARKVIARLPDLP
jgi:A/G-specific adenine glycosylase